MTAEEAMQYPGHLLFRPVVGYGKQDKNGYPNEPNALACTSLPTAI